MHGILLAKHTSKVISHISLLLTPVRYACFPENFSLLVVNVLRMSDALPLVV